MYTKATEQTKSNVASITGGMGKPFTRKDGTSDINFEATTSGFSFATQRDGRMGVNVTLGVEDVQALLQDVVANKKDTLKLTVFCDTVPSSAGSVASTTPPAL